jgi:hypothetical protein
LSKREKKRRSVWREMSFLVFILKSNAVSLKIAVDGFAKINRLFLVEKRIKKRKLQLQI